MLLFPALTRAQAVLALSIHLLLRRGCTVQDAWALCTPVLTLSPSHSNTASSATTGRLHQGGGPQVSRSGRPQRPAARPPRAGAFWGDGPLAPPTLGQRLSQPP